MAKILKVKYINAGVSTLLVGNMRLKSSILMLGILLAATLFYFMFSWKQKVEYTEVKCGYVDLVEIIVLVDNYPSLYEPSLKTAWGISMLVKVGNVTILFDTGPSPEVLEHNCRVLGVDLSEVDFVVISHEHGDHVGGLPYLAKVKPGCRVYVPSRMSSFTKNWIKSLNLTLIEVKKTTVIAKGVVILGELYGPPWEQALVVNTSQGLVVLVGCSHPGIVNIVDKAVKEVKNIPYLVLGGFHMASCSRDTCIKVVEELLKKGARFIAPIHCSGDTIREVLESKYPKHYLKANIGARIRVGGSA